MALSEQQLEVIKHPVKWFFSTEGESEGEVPRKELAGILFATLGQSSMFGMTSNWFFPFCTNVLKLDPVVAGMMSGSMTVFDTVCDPVSGVIIDSHRFKDGRKLVPWIRGFAPFAALLSLLLFVNFNLPGTALKVAYCVVIYLIWDVLYSFMNISLMGLTAAISPQSRQRGRAAQWMDIGVLIGSYFPELLLPMLGNKNALGASQQTIFLVFAAIMCIGGGLLFLSATSVKERIRVAGDSVKKNIFKTIGVLRHNRILLVLLAVELLRFCSPFVNELFVFQQLEYRVGGKTISATTLVAIFTVLAGLPGASTKFFATRLADKVGGMKNVIVIATITDILTRVSAWAVGIGSIPRLAIVYVIETISNIPWGVDGIAKKALLSDSVDYVEWKTGQRTEGMTMSARSLTAKVGIGLRRMIIGFCLRFLQYDAEKVELGIPQNEHYRKWVWPTFKLGIAGGALLSLIPLLLLRYPDSLRRQVETELAERRALAAAKEEIEAEE